MTNLTDYVPAEPVSSTHCGVCRQMSNKGTSFLKGWLKINVLKTLVNGKSMRKSVGYQVEGISAVTFIQCAKGSHTCRTHYALAVG